MAHESRDCLLRQLATAWQLTEFHLNGLVAEECLWRPARSGPHVHQAIDCTWRAAIEPLTDDDPMATQRTRWPMRDKPFGDVVGWVNVELTKNAAEIGYARFLYATRAR